MLGVFRASVVPNGPTHSFLDHVRWASCSIDIAVDSNAIPFHDSNAIPVHDANAIPFHDSNATSFHVKRVSGVADTPNWCLRDFSVLTEAATRGGLWSPIPFEARIRQGYAAAWCRETFLIPRGSLRGLPWRSMFYVPFRTMKLMMTRPH